MARSSMWMRLLTALVILLSSISCALAEGKANANDDRDSAGDKASNTIQPASLVINNKRLVTFYSTLDGLNPDERVERSSIVLHELSQKPNFNVNTIHAVEGQSGTDILAEDQRIATITEGDAEDTRASTKVVANDFILKAKYALIKKSAPADAGSMAIHIAFCIIGFLVLVLLTALVCRIAIGLCDGLNKVQKSQLPKIHIQDAEIISSDTMFDMATTAIKFLQLASICSMFTAYVLISLSFFPDTRPISDALVESARIPLVSFGDSVIEYLPKLFTIAVIGLITYCGVSIARFVFDALRDGTIRIADFDPDWSEPTYKLSRFILVFFGLVCALPYLPGWDTPAFKQLGLIVGVLISFGSSTAIGNMMAGVVLTYTNAFRLGDRVSIGDKIGDVMEKTLFVTKMRTTKGEIVSLPNAQILSSAITNYSAEGKQGRLILHTTITIGYDMPWRQVTEALISAAKATPLVLAEPAPFVLQSSLDDFYVSYEINLYTDHPERMHDIYSNLNANIQDAFFKDGLEIMSPNYTCLRDGNRPAVPAEHLPSDYTAPGFKITHTASNV